MNDANSHPLNSAMLIHTLNSIIRIGRMNRRGWVVSVGNEKRKIQQNSQFHFVFIAYTFTLWRIDCLFCYSLAYVPLCIASTHILNLDSVAYFNGKYIQYRVYTSESIAANWPYCRFAYRGRPDKRETIFYVMCYCWWNKWNSCKYLNWTKFWIFREREKKGGEWNAIKRMSLRYFIDKKRPKCTYKLRWIKLLS